MAAAAQLTVRISAQIADLQKEMKTATSTIDRFVGDFDKSITKAAIVGGALGGVMSALPDLVIGALRSFTDFSGQMSDLSERTGIGVRELQRLGHAGDLVGVSLDQITQAVAQMQNRLSGGDASAVGAMRNLGLTFDQLRQLNPAQQFEAIASRIAAIQDPAKRTEVAMDVFGRSGSAIMALLRQDIKKTGDEFERFGGVVDEETIKAGDQLGDLFTKAKSFGIRFAAEALSPVLDAIKGMNDPAELARWEKFKAALDTTAEVTQLKALARAFDALRTATREIKAPTLPSSPLASAGLQPIATPTMDAAELKSVYDELADGLKDSREAMDKATRAAEAHREAIKSLRDELSGAKLQGDVRKLQEAFKGLTPEQLRNADTFDRVAAAAKRLFDEGATLTPELFRIVLASERLTPAVESAGEAFFNAGKEIKIFYDNSVPIIGVIRGIGSEVGDVFGIQMPEQVQKAIENSERMRSSLDDLAQSLTQLAQVSGGSFGAVTSALATVVTGIKAARDAITSLKTGLQGIKDGDTLNGILSMASGIMGIATAAIAAGKAIFGIFKREGRDLVKDFAESFGGFDELHKKLLELGESGEQLWIKLTQGNHQNNPDAAQRVIDEVIAALEEQKRKQQDAIVTTEEGAQATIETAAEAVRALKDVSEQLLVNMREWEDWSRVVTGALQKVANEIRALPGVPSPGNGDGDVPGFAHGTHGRFIDFGTGTTVRLHGLERISTPGEDVSGGGDLTAHIHVSLDGKPFDEKIERIARERLATGAWRPRAPSGRVY